MRRLIVAAILAGAIAPSLVDAQKPVEGPLGNYSKMLGKSLESPRRFCRYHDGAFAEGETENIYECRKGSNKTGRGVILQFHFVNAYGSYEVLGIKIDAVLSRPAGVNAYEWFRKTQPWESDAACKVSGHAKKCRRLQFNRYSGSAFTKHQLDFYWHADGNIIINGALVLGLD